MCGVEVTVSVIVCGAICHKFVCDVHEKDQLVSLNRFKDNMINTACSKK